MPFRASKRMQAMINFANFSAYHHITPIDLAELITLASKAHKAGERYCNTGDEASQNLMYKAKDRFESKAINLGFGIAWYGLAPTMKRDGRDISLPNTD